MVAILGFGVLIALYALSYSSQPARPGANPAFPDGWWGWFDQSMYLRSAHALASFDLRPVSHHYPLGYAVLAAPFLTLSAQYGFAMLDLACLLATYAAYLAFARRIGVGTGWAVLLFVGGLALRPVFLAQWVFPWTTTPAAMLIWLLVATVAGHLQGVRRPMLIGALALGMVTMRPTEAPLAAIAMMTALPWNRPTRIAGDAFAMALGGLIPLVPYLLLHWSIYGFALSPYMQESGQTGFTLYDLGWKAYTVFIDPRAWFLDGFGLLKIAPYLALSVAGVVVAWVHGRAVAMLGLMIVAHSIVYLTYLDLLPTGFWRFNNVHYWKWAMPAFALLGFILVRDLLRWRRAPAFPLAPVALAASLVGLCLRIVPHEVGPETAAKMLYQPGREPGFDAAYFGPLVLRDARGEMSNVRDFRVIPVPGGIRVFALRRDFVGAPTWVTPPRGWLPSGDTRRYAERIGFGLPCWWPSVRCSKLTDDLLPQIPKP